MAEWLGRGLQSPVLRFESGRRLQEKSGDEEESARALASRSVDSPALGSVSFLTRMVRRRALAASDEGPMAVCDRREHLGEGRGPGADPEPQADWSVHPGIGRVCLCRS